MLVAHPERSMSENFVKRSDQSGGFLWHNHTAGCNTGSWAGVNPRCYAGDSLRTLVHEFPVWTLEPGCSPQRHFALLSWRSHSGSSRKFFLRAASQNIPYVGKYAWIFYDQQNPQSWLQFDFIWSWKGCPDLIMDASHLLMEAHFQVLEEACASFHCQSFFNNFSHTPIIPCHLPPHSLACPVGDNGPPPSPTNLHDRSPPFKRAHDHHCRWTVPASSNIIECP